MIKNHKCKKHGITIFVYREGEKSWRCRKCSADRVIRATREKKLELVKIFGGKCVRCGYNKYVGALQFHHINPKEKSFGIASMAGKLRLPVLIEEAKKCILVCANCHAEIENENVSIS